jgi:hypothetical protein
MCVGICNKLNHLAIKTNNNAPMPFWLPVEYYSHNVSWLSIFWQSHPYPVMSVCSKNAKLGPSTEAASVQLPERAQSLLVCCLSSSNDIDGAYYYEAIGTASIPGSLSHLSCVTDEQLMTIYHYCGFYNVKRNLSKPLHQVKDQLQIVEVSIEEVESRPCTNPSELKEFHQHLPFRKLLITMNDNKIRLELR